MFKRSVLAVAVICVVALSSTCLFGAEPGSAPDLPAGDMQAKARTACMECHESRIILQQRLSKAAWTKEVDKMIKWGALVDPKDRDTLIEYLSTNFPAEKAPQPAERVAKK
jgi:mono/diheme cytochrome c family protein